MIRTPRRALAVLGLATLLVAAGCDPKVYGTARLDGDVIEIVDVEGSVSTDGTELVYRLSGWSNPSCSIADDENGVRLELRVDDVAAVPLGEPIDVSAADGPVRVSLSMGAMGGWCLEEDCADPVFSLAGTLTLTALTTTEARGSVDLTLTGDVPFTDQPERIFERDAVLSLTWDGFAIPDHVDHCH
jgi:hypothetical protein